MLKRYVCAKIVVV